MSTDVSERVLDDGLRLRLIRPDDEPRLIALYTRLSQDTAYQRFFTAMKRLPTNWAHFLANVDHQTRLALVIERQDAAGPEVIAVGRYEPTAEAGVAEVAFVVQDGWQGKGLGRILAANYRMLRLLSRHTRILERKIDAGVAELLFEPQG